MPWRMRVSFRRWPAPTTRPSRVSERGNPAATGDRRGTRPIVAAQGLKVGPGPLDPRLSGEFTYQVIETSQRSVTLLDKRGTERLRTRLRSGLLSDERNTVIVDCLIQDRSRNGARLRLAHDRPLPRAFLLADDVAQARFWAQLAWQKGCDAGVRLVAI